MRIQSVRQAMLEHIHDGHQSLPKERMWWPKISADMKPRVETYHFSQTNKCTQRKEPLQPTPLPERPWQKLTADLREWRALLCGVRLLLTVLGDITVEFYHDGADY